MPYNFDGLHVVLGDISTLTSVRECPPLLPFSDQVLAFLEAFSRRVLRDSEAKSWPDVVSLGFWCRRASLAQMQATRGDPGQRIGRGVAFHIAPGNVAANFAYSLFTGLLTGNANVVRLPGRDHPQVAIITRLLQEALEDEPALAPYIFLVRYEHQQSLTDALSALCDTRIIWGGDETIAQIRRSPLGPRALDIAFSDRYSLAAIDADSYLAHADKTRVAQAFYNDTLLNDQNACSSPSLVVWLGRETHRARELFWQYFQQAAESRYQIEAVAAVDKLTRLCLLSTHYAGARKVSGDSNLIVRIELPSLDANTLALRGNCGFFMEFVASSLDDMVPVCGERCQTLATFGIADETLSAWFDRTRPKGIDRIVPIGRTLDFTLDWDGYDLIAMLTRSVSVITLSP
jgi:hypothetical protein